MAELTKEKKPGKMVDMYHGLKDHINIKESLVDAHLKCGWRLKK